MIFSAKTNVFFTENSWHNTEFFAVNSVVTYYFDE